MSESADHADISEEELIKLTDLFLASDGCAYPLTKKCREAKNEFRNAVLKLYFDRFERNEKYKEYTSSIFHSAIRNICRQRLAKASPPFPCP